MFKNICQLKLASSFFVYLFFLFYGLFQVYNACQEYLEKNSHYGFEKGWHLLSGRWRDNMDYEWESWKSFLNNQYGYFIIHSVLSTLIRLYIPKAVFLLHFIVGCTFIVRSYGVMFLFLLVMKNMTFYYLANSRFYTWCLGFIWILLINFSKLESVQIAILDEFYTSEMIFQMIIIISWNLLKDISFKLEALHCNEAHSVNFKMISFLGYAFYFPTMFFGPFFVFEKYVSTENSYPCFKKQLQHFVQRMAWIIGWLFMTEFFLHYFYVNNLQMNHDFVNTINIAALYGFGYIMGQFFFLKYFVFYGISLCIAEFDLVKIPKPPRCIGSIHRYSMMWKHFDAGLYEFLYRFIYMDMIRTISASRIVASLTTFMFVYLWHGLYMFILVWSVLNFISLQLEHFIRKHLKSNSLVLSQLFIFSAIANFFFISGSVEIGVIFLKRTYIDTNLLHYLGLSVCTYFMFTFCEIREENNRGLKTNNL